MSLVRHNAPNSQRRPMMQSRLPHLLFVLGFSFPRAGATPITDNVVQRRDSSQDGSQSVSPKVWVPIVVACIVLLCIALMTWTKRQFPSSLRMLSFFGAGSATTSGGATAGTRELTAEQLAGTINGGPGNLTSGPPRTARRPRRPRRTPSQMSVTSLPEYNKEPGDEELVIFRGRDMEDATMPAAVTRTSADDDESSMSHDHSQVSRYSPMPTSAHNMPLLHRDDPFEGDLSLQSLQEAPEEMQPRRSSDTGNHEAHSLMRIDSNNSAHSATPDPRGEAPAYFEVVDQSTAALNPSPAVSPSSSPDPTPPNPNRRSGFRNLLNRMSIVGHPHGHNRNESNGSAFSANNPNGLEPSVSRLSHRTNPSGSGSILSSSMFRTISRQKSVHTLNSARLNSPSMISLNSISAPLTHTATRTEITYPRAGPTAEQLKVISSRETFTRFGVPYGADAIAFASSSRLDLLLPPPDFETAASERPPSPGPSRLRSTSNVGLTAAPSRLAETSQIPPAETGAAISAQPSTTLENDGSKPSPTAAPTSPVEPSSSISKNHDSISGPTTPPADQSIATTSRSSISGLPSNTKRTVDEFGELSVLSPSAHDTARSESKASVYSSQTFATAAESMSSFMHAHMPSTIAEGMDQESSGAPTPRMSRIGGQHRLEASDATVTHPTPTAD